MELGTNRVLFTGALGWLGLNFMKALQQGLTNTIPRSNGKLKVRALALPGQDASPLRKFVPDIEVVTGDLVDPQVAHEFVAGMEGAMLFHTAGIIHPQKMSDLRAVNVDASRNLLEAATRAKVKRAVLISSNSPCGCNPSPDHRFTEESPYNPYMGYGVSKMRMEQMGNEFHKSGKIETVILRPVWFYGPQQPPRQTLFFQMVRDGKAPIVGSGNNQRSMAYVDNICDAMWRAAAVPSAAGETYWVADSRPYTMNEIVDTIELLLEKEFGQKCTHGRLRLPNMASEVALVMDKTMQAVGLYHPKIHVLSEMNKNIACSVDKAKRDLGYAPAVELEEGMRRSMQWLRDNNIPL